MRTVLADVHILYEGVLSRQASNCAHSTCAVHVNNATTLCGWKLAGQLPACGEGLTTAQKRV